MAIFKFGSKKKEEPKIEEPAVRMPALPEVPNEPANLENIKTKVDLILSQIDSLKIRYESLNERIILIEKMVKEMYDMAKS